MNRRSTTFTAAEIAQSDRCLSVLVMTKARCGQLIFLIGGNLVISWTNSICGGSAVASEISQRVILRWRT
ncbi:hypothetical protein C4D60_Mb04t14490 [Musa balbisiana]|uniref:Uncharacterized protein n=1 Tax=Musa balbisiana TaxID=52838 RepID=A0A4V4H9R9_MUSBA|nr:hypothetical protein C4D60_Mb04t14490 [Musa balbisiana]